MLMASQDLITIISQILYTLIILNCRIRLFDGGRGAKGTDGILHSTVNVLQTDTLRYQNGTLFIWLIYSIPQRKKFDFSYVDENVATFLVVHSCHLHVFSASEFVLQWVQKQLRKLFHSK